MPEGVGAAGGQRTRLLDGGGGQRGERAPRVVGELGEKGGGDEGALDTAKHREREDEREEEGSEPDYFRLTHFTRRHPLNMLTFATSSGTSPTCCSSGAIERFDFQPRRVQTGATMSSKKPV